VLEVAAYRETILRQRINEAGQAVMLPYAAGTDLDNLATLFGVQRLITQAAQPDQIPPIPAVYETDAQLRRRVQLSLEGLSVAGPEGAYVFHALSADGRALDASASSPGPGEVVVTVLARAGNGVAPQDLLDAVQAGVSAEDVRPLTDHVTVASAEIINYTVEASLYVFNGPDSQVILSNAQAAIATYTADQHRLGLDITLSGVYAALHQPGVQHVELRSPSATITITPKQAAYCTGITVDYGGVDE
jgi:phage-related baseplate assembly protein